MNISIQKIRPCLWLDNQAEEAAAFYTSIFDDSRIVHVSRYGEVGEDIHGRKPGTVQTVTFEIAGQQFVALNGGPLFTFNESISFQVSCDSQEQVDYYWEKLGEGGDEEAQQCGWLKDKYGLAWQIVPTALLDMLNDPDREKADRVMEAMLQMKKLDIDRLRQAFLR